jgi:hypothetical protein
VGANLSGICAPSQLHLLGGGYSIAGSEMLHLDFSFVQTYHLS